MRAFFSVTLIAAISSTVALAEPVAGGTAAGKVALGLRAPAADAVWRSDEDSEQLQLRGNDFNYGGVRGTPRAGLYSVETYSGIFRPLFDHWGSTLETGISRDTPFSLSRYSITGQFLAALAPRHGLSLGLKLSTADRSSFGAPLLTRTDPASANELLTERGGANTSYEFQLNYLYGTRHSVGMSYQGGNTSNYYAPYGLNPNPRVIALTSQHRLSPNWAMSYDISASEPSALLQSPSLGLGLRYRF